MSPKALSWTCSSSCLRLPISGLSPALSFHALAPARPDPSQVSATTCLLTRFHAALLEETKATLWPGSDFPQTPITLLALLLASLASLSTAAASEFARNLPRICLLHYCRAHSLCFLATRRWTFNTLHWPSFCSIPHAPGRPCCPCQPGTWVQS